MTTMGRSVDDRVVIAVDVGTGSARAGVFTVQGHMLARDSHPILINRPVAGHAEHSSVDIWQAVVRAVRGAVADAGVSADAVSGIGFDATCSLVALDADGAPVSVSTTGDDRWDTIVWLDHRAVAEAEACTATRHSVLDYIGGVMSPEMEIPKLMWLKRHLPASWRRFGLVLDLADFLTWRATGNPARSTCTITCKWTFLSHEKPGWQAGFLEAVDLGDLRDRAGLPDEAAAIGGTTGRLSAAAAAELGLTTDCIVGIGLIDAHAGALGVMGSVLDDPEERNHGLAMIAGTSTCHMALSALPRPVPGVWGPYLGVIVPGLWCNEGGQSASGALLDHILALHAEGRALGSAGHDAVLARIAELRADAGLDFAAGLHVLPDFHGNRSPLADPHARGVISGLTLDASFDSLARLYFATAVGIALGTRHILDALNAKGYDIRHLYLTGGHARNPLLVELYADVTGCSVVLPEEQDGVLLGTAMTAAAAAGLYPSLTEAARAMAHPGHIVAPDLSLRDHYAARYRVFLTMHEHRHALDAIMAGAGAS